MTRREADGVHAQGKRLHFREIGRTDGQTDELISLAELTLQKLTSEVYSSKYADPEISPSEAVSSFEISLRWADLFLILISASAGDRLILMNTPLDGANCLQLIGERGRGCACGEKRGIAFQQHVTRVFQGESSDQIRLGGRGKDALLLNP